MTISKGRGYIMSQEKVNQYKESKKHRKEEVKKAKRNALLTKVIAGAVLLAVVGWIAYSAAITAQKAEKPAVIVDTTVLDEYVNTLE